MSAGNTFGILYLATSLVYYMQTHTYTYNTTRSTFNEIRLVLSSLSPIEVSYVSIGSCKPSSICFNMRMRTTMKMTTMITMIAMTNLPQYASTSAFRYEDEDDDHNKD